MFVAFREIPLIHLLLVLDMEYSPRVDSNPGGS